MRKPIPLTTNGLTMPPDFPRAEYESVSAQALKNAQSENDFYSHFVGAWSAVAYRFLAVTDYEREFNRSIAEQDHSASARHLQERQLFGFFSSGFSVFEASFYGAFSLGAFSNAAHFPMASPRDQQRITPSSTINAFREAFPNDPINDVMAAITQDAAFTEWREIRNVLTHRAAPGRTFFVSFGGDQLPDQWKIKDIVLDESMAPSRRRGLASLLTQFIGGLDTFLQSHF